VATNHPLTTSNALQLAALLVESCAALGLRDFVIAPGSRSAPLTAALAASPQVRTLVVYDERSAAHIALGMAQQLRRPFGVLCTSGTAAVNFGPAVVEAFYQQIPLILFTADRPLEWIDQEDNQAIRQGNLYGAHVRAAFSLPLSDAHGDAAWHVRRTISDAVQVATSEPAGPVHINLPLREPLYASEQAPAAQAESAPAPARRVATTSSVAEAEWGPLLSAWRGARRKLIVVGMHPVDPALAESLAQLRADDSGVAVVADVTANLPPDAAPLARWDSVLASRDGTLLDALAPDLVVTLGGQVTSKALKGLLRGRPPAHLWRVAPGLPAADTYQHLTLAIPTAAAPFVAGLARRAASVEQSGALHLSDYAQIWSAAETRVRRAMDAALAAQPWSELAAVALLLQSLPADSALQVGNSLPIRYVNLLGFTEGHLPASVHANRGASGIDGVVSTAVGAALAQADADRLTTLIVGDLSFFYDRNGLWHGHLPPTLRVVLLNNHGGGIFDVIAGPDQLPADLRRDFFLTPQPLRAERTAADAGLRYLHATTAQELADALPEFFDAHAGAALLEVESDISVNSAAFRAVVRAAMGAEVRGELRDGTASHSSDAGDAPSGDRPSPTTRREP
jgi:2-succinyl-5-enolpyruvyl-6-hydroxy-3-cyclohexene-1-carboxylate synthase